MAIFVPGLVVLVVFYLLIFAVGLWAAWKKWKGEEEDKYNERQMVGGRDMGMIVGSFTMTATWVGGAYINGTAEYVYTPGLGLYWTQAPLVSIPCLMLVAIFFAKKMRTQNFTTILDPLQYKFGRYMGVLLYIPALLSDLFWSAAILAALGGTLSVIIGLDVLISVIISACIAVLYTLVGGLYSVAYTDILQLVVVLIGLMLALPFAFTHPAVSSIATTAYESPGWLGTPDTATIGLWIDFVLILTLGGIPAQVLYQRVLAMKSVRKSQMTLVIAGIGTAIFGLPSILFGAIAASTDWNATEYDSAGKSPLENNEHYYILPIVLRYLTPTPVAVIGLGALAAAVMSSIDSAILSSSSMFSRNVYQFTFRNKASKRELEWVMRCTTICFAIPAAAIAITVESIQNLWYLCIDVVYVVLFPQITSVMYLDPNTYGSLPAYFIGIILRLGGGEPSFKLDPFIHYPGGLNFPFKTFAMVVSFITLVVFSYAAKYLFEKGIIPEKYDIFQCKLASGGRSIRIDEIMESDHVYENKTVGKETETSKL
ncbi:high affinity choline transporter 1-like [Clavelina lepadiformis]|uniref:high affinity choline transporter 1-like n=1 Tax=Clavelina lepadiformis TaxID=159417 RepID=UPI004041CA6F